MFGGPDIEKLKHEQGFKGLFKALEHKKISTRIAAIRAFGQVRTSTAVEPLIEVLGDREAEVRQEAAKVLGELGDKRAVEALIARLAEDLDGGVRYRAAEALGCLRDARAAKPLLTALDDGDGDVAQAAREALESVGGRGMLKAIKRRSGRPEDLVEKLAVSDVVGLVRLALEGEQPSFIQPAAQAKAQEHSPGPRAQAALLEIGTAAVEPLVAALERRSPQARARACELLGRLGDAGAGQALALRLSSDADVGVRMSAARALGALSAAEDQATLTQALRHALRDPDYRVREEAVPALARWRAVEPLIEALSDSYIGVRIKAAQALGELGDARAVPALAAALADQGRSERDDPYGDGRGEFFPVREDASAALRRIGGAEAEQILANFGARGER